MTTQSLDYGTPPSLRRRAGRLASHFFRWHAWTAAAVWLLFTGFTFLIVMSGLDKSRERPRTVAATTAGTVLGPMTGAISRDFQGCCTEFSLLLLPWCGGGLVIGALLQLVIPPRGWWRPIRAIAWVGGLLVWFGGGIVSFAHALS